MHVRTRQSVFETNSSSSHSVTLVRDELLDFGLPKEILRSGVWKLEAGEYPRGICSRLYRPEGKLRFLLAQAEILEDDDRRSLIASAIKNATGVRIEVDASDAYIDHQSVRAGLDTIVTEDDVINFVFSKSSFLELLDGEHFAPEMIRTDLGRPERYFDHYVDVVPHQETVRLVIDRHGNSTTEIEIDGDVYREQLEWEDRNTLVESFSDAILVKAEVAGAMAEPGDHVANFVRELQMVAPQLRVQSEMVATSRRDSENECYHLTFAVSPAACDTLREIVWGHAARRNGNIIAP